MVSISCFHAFAGFYGLDLMFSRVCWFLVSRVFYAFVGFLVLFSCFSCPNQPNYQRGLTSKQGSPKIHDMNIYTISTLVYIFICIKILSLNIYTYILLFSLQGVIRILEVSQLNFLWPTRKMTRTTTTFQRQRNICRISK